LNFFFSNYWYINLEEITNIKQIIMWNWIYNVGSAISSTVSAAATYFGGKKAGSSIQDGIQNGSETISNTLEQSTNNAITTVVNSVSPIQINSKEIAKASTKAAEAIAKISNETERAVTVFEKQSKEAIKQLGIVNNNLVEFVNGVVMYIDKYEKNITNQYKSKLEYIEKEYNTFKGYVFIKFLFSISRDLGFIFMSLSLCYNYNKNLYNSCAYVLSIFFSTIYNLIISSINIFGNIISWLIYISIIILIPILILYTIQILGQKYYNHNNNLIKILNNTIKIQNKIKDAHNTKKILELIDNKNKEYEEIKKEYILIKQILYDLKKCNNNYVAEEKKSK
jgi:hypothetical protein